MIKPSSIQAVKERLNIVSTLGHFVKLDSHNKACCPFHDEKTPSFSVDAKKEIFKCFGCGEGGDAIAFVMKHEKVSFIEAIEKIADIIGVTLEHEEIADPKKYEAGKRLREQMDTALLFTIETYRKQLWRLEHDHPIRKYIRERKLTQNEVAEWQLGWSTTDWRFITPSIINENLYSPAEKLGIVKRSKNDESNYDGYRSRIIIPIQDHHGKPVGLAGRYIKIDSADEGKNFPKYVNSNENELYSKSRVLFGLSRAVKAIKELKFVYLVEGYLDVITMHKGGHQNTIASCGTALTDSQCQLLSHYTKHVCILRDGDDSGIAAAKKDIFILLRNRFKVSIITLPKGEDPDSYVSAQMNDETVTENFIATLPAYEDAVFWYVRVLVEDAQGDTFNTGHIKWDVIHLLSNIVDGFIRGNYLEAICKKYKWKAPDLQKELDSKTEKQNEAIGREDEGNLANMPEWMNKDEFMTCGFCEVRNKKNFGYWAWGPAGKVQLTNFLIKPLFHIYAGKESRYMITVQKRRFLILKQKQWSASSFFSNTL